MSKPCPVPGCTRQLGPADLFCRDHWGLLGRRTRRAVWRAHHLSGENTNIDSVMSKAVKELRVVKRSDPVTLYMLGANPALMTLEGEEDGE